MFSLRTFSSFSRKGAREILCHDIITVLFSLPTLWGADGPAYHDRQNKHVLGWYGPHANVRAMRMECGGTPSKHHCTLTHIERRSTTHTHTQGRRCGKDEDVVLAEVLGVSESYVSSRYRNRTGYLTSLLIIYNYSKGRDVGKIFMFYFKTFPPPLQSSPFVNQTFILTQIV